MALSPHTKDTNLMISAVVAIVAFAGLIMIYSDSSAPTGATTGGYQLMPLTVDAGKRCGECAKTFLDTNIWDSKTCPLMDTAFAIDSTKLTYDCCRLECERMATNINQDYYTNHCGQICKNTADCAFGYCRYAGGKRQNI